jgi:hypothetical protein
MKAPVAVQARDSTALLPKSLSPNLQHSGKRLSRFDFLRSDKSMLAQRTKDLIDC